MLVIKNPGNDQTPDRLVEERVKELRVKNSYIDKEYSNKFIFDRRIVKRSGYFFGKNVVVVWSVSNKVFAMYLIDAVHCNDAVKSLLLRAASPCWRSLLQMFRRP